MSEVHRSPHESDDEQLLAEKLDEHAIVIERVQALANEVLTLNQIAALPLELREETQELKDQTVRRSELWSEFLTHAAKVHGILRTSLPVEPRTAEINRLIAELTQQRGLDQEILTIVERHFRDAIRPRLVKHFGTKVVNKKQDAFVRYTQMVDRFFEKVLDLRPDKFWRATSVAKLRNWASMVMTNDMIDQLRHRKQGQEILDELGALALSRKVHFEKYNEGIDFEVLLEWIDRWEETGTASERRRARVLRRHYVDGAEYDEIASEFGTNVKRVSQWKVEGIEKLKEILNL